MNLFGRLGIGTANWGQQYNGARVSDDDQKRILAYAQCAGIDLIDTATAYLWSGWRDVSSCFRIVLKVQKKQWPVYGLMEYGDRVTLMAHCADEYKWFVERVEGCRGASLYKPGQEEDVFGGHIVQVPYSLYDRRFEVNMERNHEVHEIHVRSIYLRGKILEKATPQECLKFVLCNPFVDRVIIGADSFDQFRANVEFIHTWNAMEKQDERLLDPRQWTEKEMPDER